MAHFSSPQWIDLVRDVMTGDVQRQMENHLLNGCAECHDAHKVWQKFAGFAQHENDIDPPDEAVQTAKLFIVNEDGMTRGQDTQSGWDWATSLIPTLVFDSLQEALPAGVRAAAAAQSSRYLLYAASDLMIDLHVDVNRQSGLAVIVGQIANAAQPGQPLPDVRVTLVRAKKEITVYRVNAQGEFHAEFQREKNLALSITVQGREPIVIPLDRLFEPPQRSAGPRSKHSRW
jgi:hypothetical protein